MKPTREQIEHRAIEILLKRESRDENDCDFCKYSSVDGDCPLKYISAMTETALEQAEKELSKPTLTEDEKVILRNLPKYYKWICRSRLFLNIYQEKPMRDIHKDWLSASGVWNELSAFGHLFQFITSEDEDPYSIEELLNEE